VLRKKRFLIGGLVVILAIGYLAYAGFTQFATYYYTVSEVLAQGNSIYNENVQVKGQVAPGSIEQQSGGLKIKFTIVDMEKQKSLPVAYQGAVPDTFKAGADVVVEGYLDGGGIFQARTIMPQCASRYVPVPK